MQFLGSYELIRSIGKGAAAEVFLARHVHPSYAERTFAIKVMHGGQDAQARARFHSEAYVLSLLKHPNIVATFECGAEGDQLYIAMEYIYGHDLHDTLARLDESSIHLPMPLRLHMLAEVLRGLAYAHDLMDADGRRLNLVHRDISPSNIFLSYDGATKLGDFGVAAFTAAGQPDAQSGGGKIGYLSPEQLAGRAVTQETDVYAFGAVMFDVLCGRPLYDADTESSVLRQNRSAKVPKLRDINPEVPKNVEDIVLKCLERDAERRFPNARHLHKAFEPIARANAIAPFGVAALLRHAFQGEFSEESKERLPPLSSMEQKRVVITMGSELRRVSIGRAMQSQGMERVFSTSIASLKQRLDAAEVVDAVLVDVDENLHAGELAALCLERDIPVVAYSKELNLRALQRAAELQAGDLIVEPVLGSRIRAACWDARHAPLSHELLDYRESQPARRRRATLLVSRDAELASRLTQDLGQYGYDITRVDSPQAAAELSTRASHRIVIYDCFPKISGADRQFIDAYRKLPGMEAVPVLYLVAPGIDAALLNAERSQVRRRNDLPTLLAASLDQLLLEFSHLRTFVRVPVRLGAMLRVSGRSFPAEVESLSRGGALVWSEAVPPMGSLVSVGMQLPRATVHANARVVYQLPPETRTERRTRLGLEFESMGRFDEGVLVAFVCAKLRAGA